MENQCRGKQRRAALGTPAAPCHTHSLEHNTKQNPWRWRCNSNSSQQCLPMCRTTSLVNGMKPQGATLAPQSPCTFPLRVSSRVLAANKSICPNMAVTMAAPLPALLDKNRSVQAAWQQTSQTLCLHPGGAGPASQITVTGSLLDQPYPRYVWFLLAFASMELPVAVFVVVLSHPSTREGARVVPPAAQPRRTVEGTGQNHKTYTAVRKKSKVEIQAV